jgi:type IV secretory pathway ATPase VirB11/archaellum biosynthesis ATPase
MGLLNLFNEEREQESEMEFEGNDRFDFTLSEEKNVKLTKDVEEPSDVDVRYPLIRPFAQAHVEWDDNDKTLRYYLKEPNLDDGEERVMRKIKDNLSEKIDVSLSSIQSRQKIIAYLEKKIDDLLLELGIKLEGESEDRILYYIYRDYVGLGKVEPLMHDPYIEDIGCDGVGTPIFAVHSEFGSVKTDVAYEDEERLENVVVKLAERAGKYVSYADPLLDGALPDGSRVNASLTEDVTSKGPTFSIRKFQDTPFSAVDMMDLGTANAEIMAYMWIMEQYNQSFLVVGGTSTGKTSFLNSVVSFIPPEEKVVSIEDSVTGDTQVEIRSKGEVSRMTISELADPLIDRHGEKLADGAERVEIEGMQLPTMSEGLEFDFEEPESLIRHEVDKPVFRVKTATGREIKTTADHSLFGLRQKSLHEVSPRELEEGDMVATPRKMDAGPGVKYINVMEEARNSERIFLKGKLDEFSRSASCTRTQHTSSVPKSGYKQGNLNGMAREGEFKCFSSDSVETGQVARTNREDIRLPLQIQVTNELCEFLGLWLGNGSFDHKNQNRVMVTTSENEAQELTDTVAGQLDINYSEKPDGTVSLDSVLLYELMKGLGFKGGSSAEQVPDLCRNFDKQQIGALLRGYFSANGGIKEHKVSCSSQSRELVEGMQELLLKLGIISSINDCNNQVKLSISSQKFLSQFEEKVGFIQSRKEESLRELTAIGEHGHNEIDSIPAQEFLTEDIRADEDINVGCRDEPENLTRENARRIANEIEDNGLERIANSDLFWDRVEEVEKIEHNSTYVYDVSMPGPERFIANKFVAHNTRELRLPLENWIPSVTREMISGSSATDVDMDQLLKESFRQNPDYVIIGEVRGEEASVLFQGLSSGHPGAGTMHASSPGAVVKRLITPPISLSPALVEALDALVVMTHAKGVENSARRVKAVHELQKVVESGSARTNEAFSWTARTDSFNMRGDPKLFDQISEDYGVPKDELREEFEQRKQVLEWLQDKGVTEFSEVADVIASYYKDREKVVKMVSSADSSLEDVVEAEQEAGVSRPNLIDSADTEVKPEEADEIPVTEADQEREQNGHERDNPVEELQQRIQELDQKVDGDLDQNPFDNSEGSSENPFEA